MRLSRLLLALALSLPSGTAVSTIPGRQSRLRLRHLHTGESVDVVYKRGDDYVPEAVDELDRFLSDYRTGSVHEFDPRLFDLLSELLSAVGRPEGRIEVVCGYRSPETNEMLRRRHARSGVAKHSLHMQGEAIDIRVPGVRTARLRDAARALGRGGVGYYRRSDFVHVDVGRPRTW